MLSILSFALIVFLVIGLRIRGPLVAFAIAWLIAIVPLATKLLIFNYFDPENIAPLLILLLYLTCFVLGVIFASTVRSPVHLELSPASQGSLVAGPIEVDMGFARFAWWISIVAMIAQIMDYVRLGGAGLEDLPGLRDLYQARSSSVFTLAANVTSWACLYCFAYAIFYRDKLQRARYLIFLLPTAGYFLTSVLSAGRQAAMQILLVAILLPILKNRLSAPAARRKSTFLTPESLFLAAAMIFYMGYIAVGRNDGNLSTDKSAVLSQIFDFQLGPVAFIASNTLPPKIFQALVEATVYFSSSTPLFTEFLLIPNLGDFEGYGAMSFPFILRQLEPLTGLSVIGALQYKMELMSGIGAMGAGWTNAISGFILDFGYIGAAVAMFSLGLAGQLAWVRARLSGEFHDCVIGTLFCIAAIYTPLLFSFSDTSLLLLWLVCMALAIRSRRLIASNPALRKTGATDA